LQDVYDNDLDGSGAGITITGTDGGVFITNTTGTGIVTGTLLAVTQATAAVPVDAMYISNAGTGDSLRVNTSGTNFVIDDSGRVGIGTSAPTRALEINHPSGGNLRLTYNDINGSAVNYTDFRTGSNGALTLNVSGTNMLTINPAPALNASGTIVVINPTLRNMDQGGDLTEVLVIDPNNSAIVTNGRLYGISLAGITQNAGHISTGINISSTWDLGISSAADVNLSGVASLRVGSLTEQGLLSVQTTAAHNLAGIVVDNDDTTNDTAGIRIDMAEGGGVPLTVSPLSTTPNSTAEGGIYYDSDDDDLYVYADGSWVSMTAQGTQTLQDAYDFDADGADATVTLTGTDGSIVFINPASNGTTSTTLFMLRQLDPTGVTALHVRSASTDDFGTVFTGAGDDATTTEAAVNIEAQAGSGALFVHRNVGAATTGTLVFIHEDNAGADTDVMMIQNDGAGNSLRVNTGGTFFVVDEEGRVGIGTASPTTPLMIHTSANSAQIAAIRNLSNGANASAIFIAQSATSYGFISALPSGFTGGGAAAHFADRFVINSEGGLGDSLDASGLDIIAEDDVADIRMYTGGLLTTNERLRITAAGNIGIDDTTPDAKLDVEGTMIVRNTTTTGTALTINGTMGQQALTIYGTMTLSMGEINFGSATTIEMPHSTGATVNNTGEMYLETDQDAFVLQAGSGVAGQIPANTDVHLPLIFQKSITLVEPDLIAGSSENVPFFIADDFNYPNGIVVTAIRVLTSADSTDEIDIEYWDDPNFGAATRTTIEALDLDNCAPAADDDCRVTSVTTPTVPNESFIMIDLDTTGATDLEWMQVTVWFYVRD
jgi:hypothetical protein